jgi:hypothetical protein
MINILSKKENLFFKFKQQYLGESLPLLVGLPMPMSLLSL